MELLFIVVGVFIFILNGRIKRLENEVKELRSGAIASRPVSISPQAGAHQAVPVQAESLSFTHPLQPAPILQVSREPSWDEAFGAWVKEDWLLKLGALIVLLGFGWFTTYAFGHWIGPVGRVTIGMLVGIGILGFGWFRMYIYTRQGSVFLGLGAIVVIISAFSAAYVFTSPQLISGRVALGIIFLTSAFLALASVRFKVQSLSVVGIIIASIAPAMLLIGSTATYTELFMYLFIIVLGVIWIVSITGWRNLTTVALTMFLLYSLPQLGMHTPESSTLLMYAYAFALLFFITNTVGILKIRDGNIYPDAITAAGNGLLLLAWIAAVADPTWKSLIMVGWMIVFIIAAFAVFAVTKRREPFFVYTGVGIAMLAAATAIDFNGAGLTIAYTIESAITVLVVYGIMRDRNIAKSLTLLILGPCLLALGSMAANWRQDIPFDHFFVLLILSAVLLLLGVFFMSLQQEGEEGDIAPVLFIGGSVYAYVLTWLSLHATSVIKDGDTATMICLVIYTIIGLIAYAYGRMHDNRSVHYYGGTLLAFVVGHLLLVDVWHMELAGKIVTFFIVGALLMGTAFMSRKKN